MRAKLGFRSITGKLLAAFLAVFIPLIALQHAADYRNRAVWRALLLDTRHSKTRAAAATVDEFCNNRIDELRTANNLLERYRYANIDSVLSNLTGRQDCIAAGLLDLSSGRIVREPPLPPGKNEMDLPREQLRTGPSVSHITRSGSTTAFTVCMAVDMGTNRPAILYEVVSTEAITRTLSSVMGDSECTVVIDENGAVLCQVGSMPDAGSLRAVTSVRPLADGQVEDIQTDAKTLGSAATSPVSGWKIAVMNAGVEMTGTTIGTGRPIWSAAIAALALILFFIMGNRIASPIRKLSRAAAAVAVGDFRRRVVIRGNDELHSLAESFNRMADCLEVHERELRTTAQVQQCLLDVSRAITSNLNLDKVAASVVDSVEREFGARQAIVFRLDEVSGTMEPIYSGDDSHPPVAESILKLAEHAIKAPGQHSSPNAVTYPNSDDAGGGTIVMLPLIVGNNPLGVLAATFVEDGSSPELANRLSVLQSFASCAAVALQNAYVHGRSEELSSMLASLSQVVAAITSSLDLKQVLSSLVKATCEVMNAKACAILLSDKKGRLSVAESHNLSKDFRDKLNLKSGERWSGKVFADRRAIVRMDVSAESDLRLRAQAEKEGLRGFMSVPLIVGTEAIGTLNVWMDRPYRAKPLEVHLISSIASHAAVVIANAKLFSNEYLIAETLQSTLIGTIPDKLGRLVFGHKYLPAMDNARVGGDLYDVVTLSNGRVALIVADVSGKGIEAAVYTGMIRYMARAFIFQWPDSPATAITLLNQALISHIGTKVMVTVFCAILDPDTGWMLYANAGHPPAIALTREGRQQILLHRTGMPVGYSDDSTYDEKSLTLLPGDLLLLYTDGIIEARQKQNMLSLEGLQDIIFRNSGLGPVQMVDRVCDETIKFADRELRDDIAVIAAALDPAADRVRARAQAVISEVR